MKLVNYKKDGEVKAGILKENGILDIAAASGCPCAPKCVDDVIGRGPEAVKKLSALTGDLIPLSEVTLAPAVLAPQKIFCVGLNYAEHAKESGIKPAPVPTIFSKFSNAIAADQEEIPLPACAVSYDYEAELVVVIGKEGKNISKEDALDYVFGYTCGDDVSCREVQSASSQWLMGKTFDKFAPIGPCVVTKDELDASALDIQCLRNGEVVQHSNTKYFIYDIPTVISYVSTYVTLQPGDIIFTGTPDGVILGQKGEKNWLKAGERIEVKIEGIGTLTNVMA